MKDAPFYKRLGFAWHGLVVAYKFEASFRTQVFAAIAVACAMLIIQPPVLWVALLTVTVGLVLAAELFNTALEHTLDGLHPNQAPFVGLAKDCAAASVMVLSGCSVIVFLLMLFEIYL